VDVDADAYGRGQSGPGRIEPESWWHRLVRLCKVDVMIVKRWEAYHIMNGGVHGRVDKTVLKLASLEECSLEKDLQDPRYLQ